MRTYGFLSREQSRYHRVRRRRAPLFLLIFTAVLSISAGCLLAGRQVTKAADAYETVVLYKSIEVAEGDTLWDLAGEYGSYQDRASYMEEVKRINHIKDDTIHAGAYLIVPCEETLSD